MTTDIQENGVLLVSPWYGSSRCIWSAPGRIFCVSQLGKVILLPNFETQDMTRGAGRRIRNKTARMMLSFWHYEFRQRLKWKAWQRGALVLEVNEAYTSKTRS